MSAWTYITACLSVDTYIEDKDITSRVKEYLVNAPKITGSEVDAEVFVNLKSGYNSYTNCDCQACEFKDSLVNHDNGSFSCDADKEYKCPSGEYQSCVIISVQGNLRDKMKMETEKEFEKFLEYISEEYHIRDYAVNIRCSIKNID